jgi:hypothetical protein
MCRDRAALKPEHTIKVLALRVSHHAGTGVRVAISIICMIGAMDVRKVHPVHFLSSDVVRSRRWK